MTKKFLPCILAALLCLTSLVLPIAAEDTYALNIDFMFNNGPVGGAQFSVYRAIEPKDDAFALTDAFAGYTVDLPEDADDPRWSVIAETLAAYVARDGITPDASGMTDAGGVLRLTGLEGGVYLIIGETVILGDVMLLPKPMIVSLPYTDAEGNVYFDFTVEPKCENRPIPSDELERRVIKIWKDDGNETLRPHEITVQLLCDGDIFDERTLNEENGWGYTWTGLDAAHRWQVAEKEVPDEYTVEITQEGITFTVTNTCDNPPPPPPPPPSTLPQTGMMWWPVPVLFGAGILFCVVGAAAYVIRGKKNEKT